MSNWSQTLESLVGEDYTIHNWFALLKLNSNDQKLDQDVDELIRREGELTLDITFAAREKLRQLPKSEPNFTNDVEAIIEESNNRSFDECMTLTKHDLEYVRAFHTFSKAEFDKYFEQSVLRADLESIRKLPKP